jgi:IS5 family transposase
MRRFAGIELISGRIPDENTILTFRHLLEKHELGEQIFETVKTHLNAGLIQSQSECLLPGLRAWVEVGGMASSLYPKVPSPQPIWT